MQFNLSPAHENQERATVPVEIIFPTSRATGSGVILESTDRGSVVELSQPVRTAFGERAPGSGASVWVSYLSGRDVFRAPGVVLNLSETRLLVAFTGQSQRVARRERHRYSCKLPALYRAVRGAGYGAWYEAEVRDINLTGAGIWVPSEVEFPPKVEIQVSLPVGVDQADILRIAETCVGGYDIIKLTGRARHGHCTKEGDTVVGMRFDYLNSIVHLKLGCFIERLCSASA